MLACHAGGPGSIPGRCNFFSSQLYTDQLQVESCPGLPFKIEGSNILGWEDKKKFLEAPGIDPGTSRMLSERSTI